MCDHVIFRAMLHFNMQHYENTSDYSTIVVFLCHPLVQHLSHFNINVQMNWIHVICSRLRVVFLFCFVILYAFLCSHCWTVLNTLIFYLSAAILKSCTSLQCRVKLQTSAVGLFLSHWQHSPTQSKNTAW